MEGEDINSHDPMLRHDIIKLGILFIVLIGRPLVAKIPYWTYQYSDVKMFLLSKSYKSKTV